MALDLVVIGLLLLFAVLGAISGALRQLLTLGAISVGALAARAWAPAVAERAAASLPRPVGLGVAALVLFLGISAAVGLVGRLLLRWVGAGTARWGAPDRAVGALLGAAKAGLAAWVVLSALVLLDRPLRIGSVGIDARQSDFAQLAREHNLLDTWHSPTAETLKRLLLAARDPRGSARLLTDADVRELLADPRVQALLEQARTSGEKGAASVVGSPQALQLLGDPAFLERLERAQRKIDEAAGRAR